MQPTRVVWRCSVIAAPVGGHVWLLDGPCHSPQLLCDTVCCNTGDASPQVTHPYRWHFFHVHCLYTREKQTPLTPLCISEGRSVKSFSQVVQWSRSVKTFSQVVQSRRSVTYLDTWSGLEAATTAPWPSRRLHHFGKVLEPSDEWDFRGCCCFLLRRHSWSFLAHQEWAPEIRRAQILIFQF